MAGAIRACSGDRYVCLRAPVGVEITTRSGRRIVSTPEHAHFAGLQRGETPPMHVTYLMWRRDKGYRVGTTRTRPSGRHPQAHGLQIRSSQEHADAAWVLSTHESEGQARAAEQMYRSSTASDAPVHRAFGGNLNGLVGDQALIDRVFAGIDTYAHGRRLLLGSHLDFEYPHHIPLSFEGRRRNVTLTLCGDRRGKRPMHVVAIGGRDEEARERSWPRDSPFGRRSRGRRAGGMSRVSATSDALWTR